MNRTVEIVLGAAVATAIGVVAMKPPGSSDAASLRLEAPQLAVVPRVCPDSDAAAAEHRGRDADRAAAAKIQEFQFDPSDGLGALVLFEEAISCFDSAHLRADAVRVSHERDDWLEHLKDTYASARLRLRVALEHRQQAEALSAAGDVDALLGPGDDPYRHWLAALRQQLEQSIASGAN